MGFLKIYGKPLTFEESKQYFETIKNNTVENIIELHSNNIKCCPKFGYEVEFHKIHIDDDKRKIQLDLTGEVDVNKFDPEIEQTEFGLHHEFGKWMIETIPTNPFRFNADIPKINQSLVDLYSFMDEYIGRNKYISVASFPMMGVGNDYYWPRKDSYNSTSYNTSLIVSETSAKGKAELNPFSHSNYIHDEIMNSHPRFGALSSNIRLRSGGKVNILAPLYKDINTNLNSNDEPVQGMVHMDAMAFGMGCACLQITLGTCSMESTCYIYDQFITLMPILLLLSSSAPIFKGKLTEFDNRFKVLSQSVDDRTAEEKDPNSSRYIYKSRYSPAYSYISSHPYSQDYFNDYPKFPINKEYFETFIKNGMSPKLAEHFCNLLVRDPLTVFDEKIFVQNKNDYSHFEGMNSSNWNSLRFKPPRPEDNDTCFKVEVRPCDLQLTPFENSSMIIFILSLFGSILNYDLNFIIPMSKVDENFERAYKMDAVLTQKFWWRVDGVEKNPRKRDCSQKSSISIPKQDDDWKNVKELTVAEILLGSEENDYPGILHMCERAFEECFKLNEKEVDELKENIAFIRRRATGELWTDAKYIRHFVTSHPLYKQDSLITDEINYDLIKHLLKVQNGEIRPVELFGK